MDKINIEKGNDQNTEITDKMLLDSATLEAWRICYIANHYVFPLYKKFETEFNITRPEWVTIFILGHEEDVCAQDIVRKTGLPKNSIGRGVNLLLNKGFIAKKDDPMDGRRSILNLTTEGWKLYSQTLPYAVGRKERLISSLSPEELQQLKTLTLKMCEEIRKQLNSTGKWE